MSGSTVADPVHRVNLGAGDAALLHVRSPGALVSVAGRPSVVAGQPAGGLNAEPCQSGEPDRARAAGPQVSVPRRAGVGKAPVHPGACLDEPAPGGICSRFQTIATWGSLRA